MTNSKKILLVEDEETLAIGLEFNLSEEGYAVTWVQNGQQALDTFQSEGFDLIILDIMLPFVDGFQVAENIRRYDQQMPILFLSARAGIKDRLKGLELGADDYLTKPFHLQELLLRVKGMLKRKEWYKESSDTVPVYSFGDNEVHFENLTAVHKGIKINLTLHEAMLLRYLIEHEGKAISRKELLHHVWNISSEIETRRVDNFISRLRKYFENDPENPTYIKSVRGVGYMFNG
ncbi:MAG: response regulator [Caldithrix sp.]|nr:response regulator [Caldithrix sp.]